MTDNRSPIARLNAIGDALRTQRRERRSLAARAGALGVLGFAVALTIVLPPSPLLVWNASASAPIGLYAITSAGDLSPGDRVAVRLPAAVRKLAAERHYLPSNVPLIKRVMGFGGDRICAIETRITINGRTVAIRRSHDGRGRPLPWWRGCQTLARGQIFLIGEAPDSLDGRYFGAVPSAGVIGKARLLWSR